MHVNKSELRWAARFLALVSITSDKNRKVDNHIKTGRNRIRLSPRTSVATVDYHTTDQNAS